MSVVGAMAILAGWLMIQSVQRKDGALALTASRRWLRCTMTLVGTWFVTAGMATVVQAGR